MRQLSQNSTLIGYVHLRVGDELFAVPVQAAPLDRDEMARRPGGFFVDPAGHYGILVDSALPEHEARKQIERASFEAVSHLSKKFLN